MMDGWIAGCFVFWFVFWGYVVERACSYLDYIVLIFFSFFFSFRFSVCFVSTGVGFFLFTSSEERKRKQGCMKWEWFFGVCIYCMVLGLVR